MLSGTTLQDDILPDELKRQIDAKAVSDLWNFDAGDLDGYTVVLVLQGGGVRGTIAAELLAQIEKITGCIPKVFDLIAGTSVGGLIAIGLTMPKSATDPTPLYHASDMTSFFVDHAKEIFHKSFFHNIYSCWGMCHSKYSRQGLSKVYSRLLAPFSDASKGQEPRIGDATTGLLVNAYDILGQEDFSVGHNPWGRSLTDSQTLYDVGLATSAAPTYFPTYPVRDYDAVRNCADGGLSMNNLSWLAYNKAKDFYGKQQPIMLLSVGTGLCPSPNITSTDQGDLQWAPVIPDILMNRRDRDCHARMMEMAARGELKYLELQPPLLQSQYPLDNTKKSNIQQLKAVADCYFQCLVNHGLKKKLLDPLAKRTPPTRSPQPPPYSSTFDDPPSYDDSAPLLPKK